jgi:hypothetical protein
VDLSENARKKLRRARLRSPLDDHETKRTRRCSPVLFVVGRIVKKCRKERAQRIDCTALARDPVAAAGRPRASRIIAFRFSSKKMMTIVEQELRKSRVDVEKKLAHRGGHCRITGALLPPDSVATRGGPMRIRQEASPNEQRV